MSTAFSFEVRLSTASVSAAANAYTKIPFNEITRDPSTAVANGEFTVPVGGAGIYQLNLLAGLLGVAAADGVAAAIYVNGTVQHQGYVYTGKSGSAGAGCAISLELADGDVVSAYVYNASASAKTMDNSGVNSHFSGFLVA